MLDSATDDHEKNSKERALLSSGERPFALHELFFSTTDQRGIISGYNGIFIRVSGYEAKELLGHAHNIIRHPDMPRGVFQMLWERLPRESSFAGYVKNRAKDGSHYWVFTANVPIRSGYLSVRFKPSSPLLPKVAEIYASVLELERLSMDEGATAAETARRGADAIQKAAKEMGFADYESFANHAFTAEMRSRDEGLASRAFSPLPAKLETSANGGGGPLAQTYATARLARDSLDKLFQRLDTYSALGSKLEARAAEVLNVTKDIRLSAMNADIAAQHLGEKGSGLGTVAQFLGRFGAKLGDQTGGLARMLVDARVANERITSAIASACLQLEMILVFLIEISDTGTRERDDERLRNLEDGLAGSLSRTKQGLDSLHAQIPRLHDLKEDVMKTILNLEVTQISGLTETARIPSAKELGAMFEAFRAQIAQARQGLQSLGESIDRLAILATAAPAQLLQASAAVARIYTHGGGD